MRQREIIRTTLGELVVAVTDEVMPVIRDPSGLYMVVSCILSDLLAHHQVRVHNRSRRKEPSYFAKNYRRGETLAAVALGILLLTQPVWVGAGAAGDQVRQTVDKLLVILKDPRLKEEGIKGRGHQGWAT